MASRSKVQVFDKDRGFGRVLKKITGLDRYTLEVGFIEGVTDPEIVERALRNEVGDGPPARPFIAPTIDRNYRTYVNALLDASSRLLRTERQTQRDLEAVGALIAADIQAAIDAMSTPPNAPATVAKKGFNDPLIETGAMRAAVTFRVTRK